MNYYEVLGINSNASEREIKIAYRRKLSEAQGDVNKLQLVNDAFNTLNSKDKRSEYDSYLFHGNEIEELRDAAEEEFLAENYDKAIEYFKRILAIQPLKDVKRRLTYAYANNGQYNMALNNTKELISLDEEADYYIDMGRIYGLMGDIKKQESCFIKANKIEESYDNMNVIVNFYLNNNDYKKAVGFIDSCIKNDQDNPFKDFSLIMKKIQVFMQSENLDGINKCIKDIKKITPKDKMIDVSQAFEELIDQAIDMRNEYILESVCKGALMFNKDSRYALDTLNRLRNFQNSNEAKEAQETGPVNEEYDYNRNHQGSYEENYQGSYGESNQENYRENHQETRNGSYRSSQPAADTSIFRKYNSRDILREGLICVLFGTLLFKGTIGLVLWLFAYLPLRKKYNIEKGKRDYIPQMSILHKVIGYFVIILTVAFVADKIEDAFSLYETVAIGFVFGYAAFCIFMYRLPDLGLKNADSRSDNKLINLLNSFTQGLLHIFNKNKIIVKERVDDIVDNRENIENRAIEYLDNVKGGIEETAGSLKKTIPFKKIFIALCGIAITAFVLTFSIASAIKIVESQKNDSVNELAEKENIKVQDFKTGCDSKIEAVGDYGNIIIDSVYPSSIDKNKINYYVTSSNPDVIKVSDKKITAVGKGKCTVTVSIDNIRKDLDFTIEDDNDYLRKESDSEYLQYDSLMNLSEEELSFIKNEIFARHGYIFKQDPYKTYFNQKPWYKGTKASVEDSEFNKFELGNIDSINSILRQKENQGTQSSESSQSNGQYSYKRYTNSRYGYSINYPDFLTNVQGMEDDGVHIYNLDGTINIKTYARNNDYNETAEDVYNENLNWHDADYKYFDKYRYVLSWSDGNIEYYKCGVVGNGSINEFVIYYPVSERKELKEVIELIYKTFNTPNIDKRC